MSTERKTLLETDIFFDTRILMDMREFFAAGYFEEPDTSSMRRWSRAVRRRFENRSLSPYKGELLYPNGPILRGGITNML
jgi:hypothetical protein